MLYYTQILFIKPGQETIFHDFEDQVLPLLQRYKGELLYRVRPPKSSVISTSLGHPYEIHLVTFPTKEDYEGYRDDLERKQSMSLKNQSVDRALLIEGTLL